MGNSFNPSLSRRAAFGGAISLAAAPALAAECPIGPPSHVKGPLVWMNMDQVELDAAYNQDVYMPLGAQISARRASNSAAVVQRLGEPLRRSYGPSEIEKLDIYRAKRPNAPVFVYVHGGVWQIGTARVHAFPAEMLVNAGVTYVPIDFIQIKEAGGDLRVMAEQVKRAIAWVYKNAKSFDADPEKLYIGGHSSGGHLCGVALVADWRKEFDLPNTFIKGGLCMSGMYDMKPVRLSSRSTFINFTDEMEQTMSSQRYLDRLRAPLIISHGTNETPEFQRQNRDFAEAVKATGKPVELVVGANYNHLEMLETLGNPYGPNGRAVLKLMNVS